MPLGSLKDLYIDELADLYDAETQMIRALPRLAEAARAPELRDALKRHSDESRLHLERLELIFTHWGERRRSRPCAGLAGIVQEADERLDEDATDDARDAAIIGVAQRIEHYEIAAYGCARTYARRLNRPDEARLLQETLDEEGRADRRLTEIAEAHINDDARTEADLQTKPASGGLRYFEANNGAKDDGWQRLPIRNDQDDDLGSFDGLVIDSVSQRPRYIVVDSGGLFVHRRYLLPFAAVEFDEPCRLLRVHIPKDIASRYPSFDRDAFEAMSDSERHSYERMLFELFPREQSVGRSVAEPPTPAMPEWVVTGTWVTVPADQAERLNDTTRSFANEFIPNREQMVARDPDVERPFKPDESSDKIR
jgi:ferritin-like metal-binding protein YciE